MDPIPEAEVAYNAADPKAVNNARKRAARLKAARLEVVRALMQHQAGRKWLYDFLAECYIFGNPFVPGQPDSTAFNCGKADVGKRLLVDVQEAAPEQYMTMIKEGRSAS